MIIPSFKYPPYVPRAAPNDNKKIYNLKILIIFGGKICSMI